MYGMLVDAVKLERRANPILNPDLRLSQMYFAKAESEWVASALEHTSVFSRAVTFDSTSELWGDRAL